METLPELFPVRTAVMDQIAHLDTLQALDQKHDELLQELDSLDGQIEQTLDSIAPKKELAEN